MLIEIHPYSPQQRLLQKVVDIMKNDGVVIFCTDTTYVFGCSINSKKAMKRIYQIKEIDKKQPLTFICNQTRQFQEYTTGISNTVFRQIKKVMPGPYTFIFEASKKIPKTLLSPRSTIGVRFPDAPIANQLVEVMNEPILCSSVPKMEEQDFHDPLDLHDQYEKLVDCVVHGGEIFITESAVIDFSVSPAEIIREGDADLSWL